MVALLTIDEAQSRVLERIRRLPAETVPVESAAGRVLAESAFAVVDLPPFASSAMDGYAVRAADTPGTLPVVGEVAAGRPSRRRLAPGEAMVIATGGVVPEGADAVVPIERVVRTDDAISIDSGTRAGAHVRPRGGDVAAGATVVAAGTVLRPAQLGALAAAGVAHVQVGCRPRAAVLATGTELRRPGEPLEPGQIYESNGGMLLAQLRSAGARAERLEPVADDAAAHRTAIAHGLGLDVLVTSGGVSVGPHDLVRRVEAELGVEEVFWGVAVKPGKPVAFGVRGDTLVFGLPGNPVSSLVAFELFVRPALLALQGARAPLPRFSAGHLGAPLTRTRERIELVRARSESTEDGVVLFPVGGQESHMIVRAAEADALVLVPAGEGELITGSEVRYLPL